MSVFTKIFTVYIAFYLPSVSMITLSLQSKISSDKSEKFKTKQDVGKICLFRVRKFNKCNSLSMYRKAH